MIYFPEQGTVRSQMSNIINIRLPSSVNHQIRVPSRTFPISSVRDSIHKILPEFPPERQRLFFRGKQLEDGHTLFEYDVGYLDTIQLFAKPVVVQDDQVESSKENIKRHGEFQKQDRNEFKEGLDSKEIIVDQEEKDVQLARELQNEGELCAQVEFKLT